MKKISIIISSLVMCSILLSGCSMIEELMAPKFDGSSIEAFEASYMKIKETLTEEEQDKINKAILYQSAMYIKNNPGSFLAAGAAALLDDSDSKSENPIINGVSRDALKVFDKKTAKQVIREYEEARK